MSRFVPSGTYTGAELAPSTARPGAHDAARIPSLMYGRRVTREQQREERLTPPPAAPVIPMARSASCMADTDRKAPDLCALPPLTRGRSQSLKVYTPREGSGPHRVLQHLQRHGGHLLYTEICAQFGIDRHALTASFKPALVRGALIRVQVGKARALALPGYEPPAQPPSQPAKGRTPRRVVVAAATPPPNQVREIAHALQLQMRVIATALKDLPRLTAELDQALAALGHTPSPSPGR